ncbi:MAG: transcription factor S [Candidatus Thermoplasmatota archaeon]
MFCPKCKSLMYPKDDKLVCKKCGYSTKKKGSNLVVTKRNKKEVTVIDSKNDNDGRPKTKGVTCPKCGHNEAYWELRQMRASDEPESRFYTCTKCGHRWRED